MPTDNEEQSNVNAEKRWNQAAKLVFGAGLLGALFVVPLGLHASIFSLIPDLLGEIGSIEKDSAKTQADMNKFNMEVVAPLNQLNATRDWLSESEQDYTNWSRPVMDIPIASASLAGTSAFERDLLAGTHGGTGAAIPSEFSSVYGAAPTSTTVTAPVAADVDATDATAKESMTLAANSDSAATTLLASAKKLAASAGSSTPGTAGLVAAQAAAMDLSAAAMRQHVLAALIRQEAAKLAAVNATVKNEATNHQNALTSAIGGSN